MNEAQTVCPNCGRHDDITPEHFARLVGANREAAMQALGMRKAEPDARPRFNITPTLAEQPDGSQHVELRRTT